MALVMNASAETANFKVYGNHFSMKPGQIKTFQDHVARFIAITDTTRNLGLVTLPDDLEDLDYRQSEDGKRTLDEKRKEGIDNRVSCLRQIIYNNQVSLRQDLERANIKADPRVYASLGEVKAYEELAGYQIHKEDEDKKKVDRIKALEAKINKDSA